MWTSGGLGSVAFFGQRHPQSTRMMGSVCSNPRNPIILVTIAALGIGLAVFLFLETATTERSLSEAAFRGAFVSVMASFQVYMTGQLKAVRAVADSLATHGSMPNYAVFARVSVGPDILKRFSRGDCVIFVLIWTILVLNKYPRGFSGEIYACRVLVHLRTCVLSSIILKVFSKAVFVSDSHPALYFL